LHMAWFRRHPAPGLIFHSDRGSQYASNDYRKLLANFKMESSSCGYGARASCVSSDRSCSS